VRYVEKILNGLSKKNNYFDGEENQKSELDNILLLMGVENFIKCGSA